MNISNKSLFSAFRAVFPGLFRQPATAPAALTDGVQDPSVIFGQIGLGKQDRITRLAREARVKQQDDAQQVAAALIRQFGRKATGPNKALRNLLLAIAEDAQPRALTELTHDNAKPGSLYEATNLMLQRSPGFRSEVTHFVVLTRAVPRFAEQKWPSHKRDLLVMPLLDPTGPSHGVEP